MNPAGDPVAADKPRMTAADADARFAALVAEHRAGKKPARASNRSVRPSDDRAGALAFALLFCLGVTAGVMFHAKPIIAILIGVPVVFFARLLHRRAYPRADGT